MNPGAIKIYENFIDNFILNQTCEDLKKYEWTPVWADKRYAGEHWMICPLIENFHKTANFNKFDVCELVEKKMKCQIKNLMFYSMLPGGDIPPHRDMVGNVGLGGLRLHIPIITNSKVNFIVAGRRVIMNTGELWALDTSYKHSVSNFGDQQRIHLVMDVIVNNWILNLLPKKNLQFYIHQIHLIILGIGRLFKYLTNKNLKISDFLSVIKKSLKLLFYKK
jgi:hypothetical protein